MYLRYHKPQALARMEGLPTLAAAVSLRLARLARLREDKEKSVVITAMLNLQPLFSARREELIVRLPHCAYCEKHT